MIVFDETPILERLKTKFGVVGLAADFAALETDSRTGGVYVITAGDDNDSQPDSRAIENVVSVDFGVCICAKNYRINQGQSALDALRPMRIEVRKLLGGWKPPGCARALLSLGGSLIKYKAETTLWVERFTTEHHYTQERQ